MSRLSRRQLMAGVGSAALLAGCGRLPWQAQAPARVSRVGVLSISDDPSDALNEALREGLRDLGYFEGQNLAMEWRYVRGRIDQYPEFAAELNRLPVEVIVAQGSAASRAAQQSSATIPVVMAFASDPVGAGLVATLARPGGNVTGLAAISAQLAGKRLELLRDTIPGIARVAMLWNPGIVARAHEFEETGAAAQALGISLQSVEVRDGGDLGRAFEAVIHERADALFLQDNPVLDHYRSEIAGFSAENRLSTMSSRRHFVVAGTLMAYGPNFAEMNRRAAYYVDRILKGTTPADLPVEQPMRFDFVVNMKTARELGITFPHEVALQITEVIE